MDDKYHFGEMRGGVVFHRPSERYFIVKLQFRKRSTAELASCNETQVSETECAETCRSNYPAKPR